MASPRQSILPASTPKPRTIGLLKLDQTQQFLVDPSELVWDWRDQRGNWANRALLEEAYARFILTRCQDYWRPAFRKFNCLFYADFLHKKKFAAQHTLYFKILKERLISSLSSFEEILIAENNSIHPLLLKLKTEAKSNHELMNIILKELLTTEKFNIAYLMQFYSEFTFTEHGVENTKYFLPVITPTKDKLSEEKIAELYKQAQPENIFGKKAHPNLRGRLMRDAHEITDKDGRVGYSNFDGYTDVAAPNRKFAHFSAAKFYKLMTESESKYVKEMHARGFNVNAGPSGSMSRMQFLFRIYMLEKLLNAKEVRRITLAIAADFVHRGHHTFIEAMQACQENPLDNRESCFGLFETPPHLLTSDPRVVYEKYFFTDFISSKMYQKFKDGCENLIVALPMERFLSK